MELDDRPSVTWNCLKCTVQNQTEYPSYTLRQNNPDDKELEATILSPQKIAELEAAFPVMYRIYALPKVRVCKHCHTIHASSPENLLIPIMPDLPTPESEPVPEPAPAPIPAPSPEVGQ